MAIATQDQARHLPVDEASERLRAIVRALPDPVLTIDKAGQMAAVNPVGARIVAAISRDNPQAHRQLRAVAPGRAGVTSEQPPISVYVDGAPACYQVFATPAKGETLIVLRDVTAETSVREVLLESRQRYKHLVELAGDFVWECDSSGAFSYVSEPGAFGYTPNQIVGRQPVDFMSSGSKTASWPTHVVARLRGQIVELQDAHGWLVRLSVDADPIHDDDGKQSGVRGIARAVPQDIERAASDALYAQSAGVIAAVADTLRAMSQEWRPDDVLQLCAESMMSCFSATGCAIHGWDDNKKLVELAQSGATLPTDLGKETIDPLPKGQAQVRIVREDAELIAMAIHCQDDCVGRLTIWRKMGDLADDQQWADSDLAVLRELDAPCGVAIRQTMEVDRLTKLSRTDSLTGLLNRRAFVLEMSAALARANRRETSGALMYVDLDQFKLLNDRCGHQAGNAALIAVSAILSGAIRPYDLVARLGGDEFAVWLEDINGRQAARSARRIIEMIAETATKSCDQISSAAKIEIGASIGIAMFDPSKPESLDELINRADRAMYRAKQSADKSVEIARPRRSAGRSSPYPANRQQHVAATKFA